MILIIIYIEYFTVTSTYKYFAKKSFVQLQSEVKYPKQKNISIILACRPNNF